MASKTKISKKRVKEMLRKVRSLLTVVKSMKKKLAKQEHEEVELLKEDIANKDKQKINKIMNSIK